MNEVLAGRRMVPGDRVYRILWVLGTDRLRAVCHCSAEREFDDPVELWEWLLAHPAGARHTRGRTGPFAGPRERSGLALKSEIKEENS